MPPSSLHLTPGRSDDPLLPAAAAAHGGLVALAVRLTAAAGAPKSIAGQDAVGQGSAGKRDLSPWVKALEQAGAGPGSLAAVRYLRLLMWGWTAARISEAAGLMMADAPSPLPVRDQTDPGVGFEAVQDEAGRDARLAAAGMNARTLIETLHEVTGRVYETDLSLVDVLSVPGVAHAWLRLILRWEWEDGCLYFAADHRFLTARGVEKPVPTERAETVLGRTFTAWTADAPEFAALAADAVSADLTLSEYTMLVADIHCLDGDATAQSVMVAEVRDKLRAIAALA